MPMSDKITSKVKKPEPGYLGGLGMNAFVS